MKFLYQFSIVTAALAAATPLPAMACGEAGAEKCVSAPMFAPESLAYCNLLSSRGSDTGGFLELTLQSPTKVSARLAYTSDPALFQGDLFVTDTSDPFRSLTLVGGGGAAGTSVALRPMPKGMFDRQCGGLLQGYVRVPNPEKPEVIMNFEIICKTKVSALERIATRVEKSVSGVERDPATKFVGADSRPTNGYEVLNHSRTPAAM